MLLCRVRVPLRPTEDPEKVRASVTNLFPGATLRETTFGFEADVGDLGRLRELIRSQRIPDTARGAMLHGLSDDGLSAAFLLGKQAAAVGRAHFGALGGPLGELDVALEGGEPFEVERAIYWLAPDTTVEKELSEVPPALRPQA